MSTIESTRVAEIPRIQSSTKKDSTAESEGIVRYALENGNENKVQQNTASASNGEDDRESVSRKKTLSAAELQEKIKEANDVMKSGTNKHLSFFVDDATGKTGVRVIDLQTKEVIKQIPPEDIVELAARLKEQVGALLDEVG